MLAWLKALQSSGKVPVSSLVLTSNWLNCKIANFWGVLVVGVKLSMLIRELLIDNICKSAMQLTVLPRNVQDNININ